MNLRSPYPYWLLKHGTITSYPSLQENITTDIAIIGSGISGALAAREVCRAGFSAIIVDKRHISTGSTAASTGLLQYELDTPLHKLIDQVGERSAVRSYLLCREAIHILSDICDSLKTPGLFNHKPSFQFASFETHVPAIEKELKARKKAGLSVRLIGPRDIEEKFGFQKPAGLLSTDGAEADAYLISHAILKKYHGQQLRVCENTEVEKIRHEKRGVILTTAEGYKIKAKKLIIACGYESQQYIPIKVQQLHSTYAIASEPFAQKDFWYKNALIWETNEPYLYVRTTSDKRIIIGGKDIPYTNPRFRDAQLETKSKSLLASFEKLFPDINFRIDYKWSGNFAGTKDGLPFIGSIRQRPHTYFSLGFGGNGITFSVIGAKMITDELRGRKNKDSDIFAFNR